MLAGMRLSGWRKNYSAVVGKPDAAFPKEMVAVFVDGCFWHGCPHCNRKLPETNQEYWEGKIKRNIERDQCNTQLLTDDGWRVVRIWEHEIRDPSHLVRIRSRIRQAMGKTEAA